MQNEVKRFRTDSVRLPSDSGRFRTDSVRLPADSGRPGTVFPPCHIHATREQVSGTVFPSCLVRAGKEQISGDEKEKLDGQ